MMRGTGVLVVGALLALGVELPSVARASDGSAPFCLTCSCDGVIVTCFSFERECPPCPPPATVLGTPHGETACDQIPECVALSSARAPALSPRSLSLLAVLLIGMGYWRVQRRRTIC
jgi:hypothetical protein